MTRITVQRGALLLLGVIGLSAVHVQSFMPKSSQVPSCIGAKQLQWQCSSLTVFLSDVPQDEAEKSPPKKAKKQRQLRNEEWLEQRRRRNSNKQGWMPEPPEDQLTLSGDIASLFLYAFMDHFLNDVYLASVFASSTSAADAAKTLDPSGTEVMVQATPVWLDSIAVGPHTVDQVLFLDLQSRVMPHFTPLLSSAGVASVSLASCWLLAGLFHKAFHFRNTLDCPTERAIAVTGKTWLTSSMLLILLTCMTQHIMGVVDTQDVSTSVLMMEGRILTPVEEWFRVLTRADFDYIFNSLGVLLTWRFLISFLLGGWSKK